MAVTDFYVLLESGNVVQLDGFDGFLILEEGERLADQIVIRFPKTEVDERTTHTATVNFRTRSTKSASTPTTIHYRLDNLTAREEVKTWTAVTPALSEVSITISSDENKIISGSRNRERMQLMVKADDGLSTQVISTGTWWVINRYGIE